MHFIHYPLLFIVSGLIPDASVSDSIMKYKQENIASVEKYDPQDPAELLNYCASFRKYIDGLYKNQKDLNDGKFCLLERDVLEILEQDYQTVCYDEKLLRAVDLSK